MALGPKYHGINGNTDKKGSGKLRFGEFPQTFLSQILCITGNMKNGRRCDTVAYNTAILQCETVCSKWWHSFVTFAAHSKCNHSLLHESATPCASDCESVITTM